MAPPERPLRELALFAGAGGGLLGSLLLGHRTVCAVEIDPYCRSVLLARQLDGFLPRFPIWDDVRTFDGRPWRGHIDLVSGGFPCQDISSAGPRTGLAGERSGLWREFARIIGEVRPRHAFIENSPHLRTRGLVTVLQDLAGMGYDARWCVLGASDVGAPHRRKRMWILADAHGSGERELAVDAEVGSAQEIERSTSLHAGRLGSERRPGKQASAPQRPPDSCGDGAAPAYSERDAVRQQPGRRGRKDRKSQALPGGANWWPVDLVSGVDDGVADRMVRVRATGNGQVPAVVELAWRTLMEIR